MCIYIDIVLHHAMIKRYFDSFSTRPATLGCVEQKCVPPQFFLTGRLCFLAFSLGLRWAHQGESGNSDVERKRGAVQNF